MIVCVSLVLIHLAAVQIGSCFILDSVPQIRKSIHESSSLILQQAINMVDVGLAGTSPV